MKFKFTTILLFIFSASFAADIIDDLSTNFKNGDVKQISKYFSTTVELSVFEHEDIYSASQAELILKDFFIKHPPTNIKVLHKVTSSPTYKFGVILLNSDKGDYRISFELKSTGGKLSISQIRIEENKE